MKIKQKKKNVDIQTQLNSRGAPWQPSNNNNLIKMASVDPKI